MCLMEVEILHIAECPNWRDAGVRMRAALVEAGHADVPVRYRLIEGPGNSGGTPFAGSPTITVNGVDLFPSKGRTSDLACRIYFTPFGLAGLPTTEQLIDGIRAVDRDQ
jgi:hypothetical protein